MIKSAILLFSVFTTLAVAADFGGVWKFDPAKSTYKGMPTPKELTVTLTPKGSGFTYTQKGIDGNGKPVNARYTFVKDGQPAKTLGFPNWDALSLQNGMSNKATITYMRGGQKVGTGTRTISEDGGTYTVQAEVTGRDGQKISMDSVFVK